MFILQADKTKLTMTQREQMTSGSVGTYHVLFEFSPEWVGLDKTVVFETENVTAPPILLDDSNECIVPPEVLAEYGVHVNAGVVGKLGDDVILPTIWCSLGTVMQGAEIPDGGEVPPTPEIWKQELAKKGDSLRIEFAELSLMSGTKTLSTVTLPNGGGGEGGGTQGPPGPPGKDGLSAYQIAVKDGFTGTETEWLASLVGPTGPAGADGKDGEPGPAGPPGKDGEAGPAGPAGQPGQDGAPGEDGTTFTPSVSEEGVISWTNNGGLQNPAPVNIKGPQGQQGIPGTPGQNGENGQDGFSPIVTVTTIDGGHTVTITDAEKTQSFNVMDGIGGTGDADIIDRCVWITWAGHDLSLFANGKTNVASFSEFVGHTPEISNNNVGLILVDDKLYWTKFDITAINGSTNAAYQEFTQDPILLGPTPGPQGEQGQPGANGQDGVSPNVSVTEIENGHQVTITDADGTQSFDVMNGAQGATGPQGAPGDTPFIGDNGNWWIGETDTGVAASGGGSGEVPIKAPIGIIVWWSGTADNVPTGWHICDGTNGTPDLRDKFILAAGTAHSVGETGGSEEVTLTVGQMPEHSHRIAIRPVGTSGNFVSGYGSGTPLSGNAGTAPEGQSQPHPNMPPYYVLCAIQKISLDETDGQTYEAGNGVEFTTEDGAVKINVKCPVVPITSAAYEALTDAEKNADVLYLILD